MKRVVITGMGVVTPLGHDVSQMMDGFFSGRSAVRRIEEWAGYAGLNSLLAAPLELRNERDIPRRSRRTMSPMSIYAAQATDQALEDAGLSHEDVRGNARIGCIMGHTTGSPITIMESYELLVKQRDFALLGASEFFRTLSHTVTMNVAHYVGVNGVVMATSAACASGLQALGAGMDLIRLGRQDMVLCGGAEELHETVTGSFDLLQATSTGYNDRPSMSPRPFDRDRDGLVCGEGAGVVLLEDYDRAVARGADIHCELLGYHTCGGGAHVSQSDRGSMVRCMQEAIRQADLAPGDIGYVNAHATGTVQGDAEEARAIRDVFGDRTPVSSLKGYQGHALGASGPTELIASLEMMRRGKILPTRNLEHVASDCEGLDHVMELREEPVERTIKNSFAFGGINSALVCGLV